MFFVNSLRPMETLGLVHGPSNLIFSTCGLLWAPSQGLSQKITTIHYFKGLIEDHALTNFLLLLSSDYFCSVNSNFIICSRKVKPKSTHAMCYCNR